MLTCTLLAVAACKKADLGATQEQKQTKQVEYEVSYDDALKAIYETQSSLYPQTKSSKKSVSSHHIFKVRSKKLNARNQKSAYFHVVNFGKDEGFAIMSGDNRASQLYAISDEGSFAPADTATNPGMRIFMVNAEQYFENEIQAYGGYFPPEGGIDTGDPNNPNPPVTPDNDYEIRIRDWYAESTFGTIIPLRWGQDEPYNNFIKQAYGKEYITGCVPTAVAMVMAYHERPAISVDGYRYDWKIMKQSSEKHNNTDECSITAHNMIANLMYALGRPGYLNVTYIEATSAFGFINVKAQSSADITNVPRTFVNYGGNVVKIS